MMIFGALAMGNFAQHLPVSLITTAAFVCSQDVGNAVQIF
jgi:hypothetical protein